MQVVSINQIKPNPSNPRLIKDDKFKKLVQSLKDFPEMANVRPIVVNQDMVIIGGNMRFKAMKEAKWKEIPVELVNWDEAKQREFIIKDNVGFGEWDWDDLANNWDTEDLDKWGLNVPQFGAEIDYSILDSEDISEQLENMTDGVKKAINIEFKLEHYEEAYELVKFWREQKAYIGGMIMEYLKAQKEKI
jgi:ParB-like chromosome segregation protein Spo0J